MNGNNDKLSKMVASNEEDLISDMLSQQKIEDPFLSNNENDMSVCANCGKEGSNLNICNKCKEVTYCNAACKKKHRSKHKKQCERRVAELHDEALFGEPPPQHGDCPICFLLLPTLDSGRAYMTCCGKMICSGCCHADAMRKIKEQKCPFCRAPIPTLDEDIRRLKKRMDVGDTYAFDMMGTYYYLGLYGFPQNYAKAIELWHKAGKFGYNNIGSVYNNGEGVERDKKKAKQYFELAAMEGILMARHNLGVSEDNAGNYDRALKHYMIAVRGGQTKALKEIQDMYMNGHVAKDHYANALRSHKEYLDEIKSGQRDKAAAFSENYRYY